MTDADDLKKQLRAFIEDSFLYLKPDVELGTSDDLVALGVIDSLGFVELVEEVQSLYGVSVSDIEITEENFGSIDAIAGFVQRKQAGA